MKESITWR